MLSVAGADEALSGEAIQMFHAQHALFAENAGQWATDDVYFGYDKGGTQIYFTDDLLEFGLSRTVTDPTEPLAGGIKVSGTFILTIEKTCCQRLTTGLREWAILGSNQ